MRRVLVDLLSVTGTRGGTETYAREIVKRLPQFLPDTTLIALTNRVGAERVRSYFPGDVHTVRWAGAGRVTWAIAEAVAVLPSARALQADVVWSPANFAPLRRFPGRVTTTHDVTYHMLDAPGLRRGVARTSAWLLERAARTSDAVITGSRAARDDLVEYLGLDVDMITVIPHGTSAPRVVGDPWSVLAPLGLEPRRPIVLSTGNRLLHKNFDGLVRAVAAIPAAERPLLVVPGSRGEDPLSPLVRELGLEGDVVLPGWITADQLEALYQVAALYVCPSLSEGFGLPVLDAMRRGCLVLANDIPVLREVGADTILYADARDPRALAAAVESGIGTRDPEPTVADDDIHARLRGSAALRAEGFTWEESARATAAVLNAAARRA